MSEALRPRIGVNKDTQFFWDGLKQGKLLIQHCIRCDQLQHPPGPCCKRCQSFELDAIVSTGRGKIHSFVRMHHPVAPPFEAGHPIVLVELEEGTRLIADFINSRSEQIYIGAKVKAAITKCDDEVTLALFEPA
tara:strand:+ start:180 stop:581 length:402 start_codon:yes stop_codon:yes gene_type:complete